MTFLSALKILPIRLCKLATIQAYCMKMDCKLHFFSLTIDLDFCFLGLSFYKAILKHYHALIKAISLQLLLELLPGYTVNINPTLNSFSSLKIFFQLFPVLSLIHLPINSHHLSYPCGGKKYAHSVMQEPTCFTFFLLLFHKGPVKNKFSHLSDGSHQLSQNCQVPIYCFSD